MELSQDKQTVTVKISETDSIHYFERFGEGSKTLIGASGTIEGNSFRYEGLHVKKYGKGKFKQEKRFFEQLDKVEQFLIESGYQLTS